MVRAYLYLALFVPLTFLFSLSAFVSTLFDSSGRVYAWHARLWARLALALNLVRVSVSGSEHLPDGPVIFMSNHQSNFDILSLLAAMPRQLHWIAKKELFEIPVFGPSMKRGGYIPLDRGD
ncbi:MAG TPA: 1-acyl-sn-glycerol-3-phosphate acyltransferase, partial [Desulfuromonadales bacterium]|nr:1-acyl-sn-glycerol-3-phosphate acyltransferase [Desulfuromonadales bacterium]